MSNGWRRLSAALQSPVVFVGAAPSLLIGILLTLIGSVWLARTAVFAAGAAEAPGVVTRMEHVPNSSEWDLTLTFADADGAVHTPQTVFMDTYCRPIKCPGDHLIVLYDPSAPDRVEVQLFETFWFRPLFYLALGLLFTAGGCFCLFALRFAARTRGNATYRTAD
jgi:Protein of unknown function (DUF3592)